MLVRFSEPQEPIDLVAHIAEAAGLVAIAVDGEVLSANSLLHEIGHDTAIIQLHARAVGIEDANDVRIDLVVAAVGYSGRFGETLRLVVDGAWADRIHVSP